MEGTGPMWKFCMFITPIFEKFAMKLKIFRRAEHPPPASSLYTSRSCLMDGDRIARWPDYFNILHQFAWSFLETPNPIRHWFTKGNETSGLLLAPTFFSPLKKPISQKPLADTEYISPSPQAVWHTTEPPQTAHSWGPEPQRYHRTCQSDSLSSMAADCPGD